VQTIKAIAALLISVALFFAMAAVYGGTIPHGGAVCFAVVWGFAIYHSAKRLDAYFKPDVDMDRHPLA
jgi:hypothetical protein